MLFGKNQAMIDKIAQYRFCGVLRKSVDINNMTISKIASLCILEIANAL